MGVFWLSAEPSAFSALPSRLPPLEPGQAESMTPDVNELAGCDERLDVALERRAIVARNLEELKQLAHAGRVMHPVAHER